MEHNVFSVKKVNMMSWTSWKTVRPLPVQITVSLFGIILFTSPRVWVSMSKNILSHTPLHIHPHIPFPRIPTLSQSPSHTPWDFNIVQLYLKYAMAYLHSSLIHPRIRVSALKYNPSSTGYILIDHVPLPKSTLTVLLKWPICIYTDRRLTCFFIELTFYLMDTENTHTWDDSMLNIVSSYFWLHLTAQTITL